MSWGRGFACYWICVTQGTLKQNVFSPPWSLLTSRFPPSKCLSPNCHMCRGQSYTGEGEKRHSGVIVQNKNSRFVLPEEPHTRTSNRMMSWEETEHSKVVFVCQVLWWRVGGGGGTLSFIAAHSLAESLQSLNCLPFWASTPNIAASLPLPRSSPPCAGSVLTSFA